MKIINKKVVVAMSGGVDSTIAAWLLKKQGYQVIGVFMKFWSDQQKISKKIENTCCSLESFNQARLSSQKIGIPIYTWNLKKSFKKLVVDDFLDQYKWGKTPNPCIYCNTFIKFGEFLRKAKKIGADYIATGHYAKLIKISKKYSLKVPKDRKKDQTYFLWNIKANILKHCLFPLSNYLKKEVKEIAGKNNLQLDFQKESQEICFVANDLNRFLKERISSYPGDIKDIKNNQTIGRHQGLFCYTLGQRSGLGLSQGPWYVFKKDLKKNILWVAKGVKNPALFKKEMYVYKVNWLILPKKFPYSVKVLLRYRHHGAKAQIFKKKNRFRIVFKTPQKAITPGQSAVFYNQDRLIGGSIIIS